MRFLGQQRTKINLTRSQRGFLGNLSSRRDIHENGSAGDPRMSMIGFEATRRVGIKWWTKAGEQNRTCSLLFDEEGREVGVHTKTSYKPITSLVTKVGAQIGLYTGGKLKLTEFKFWVPIFLRGKLYAMSGWRDTDRRQREKTPTTPLPFPDFTAVEIALYKIVLRDSRKNAVSQIIWPKINKSTC